MHTDYPKAQAKAQKLNRDFLDKKWKRGRPRIRSAAYWRAYYALKQRQWRAAHRQTKKAPEQKDGG